MPEPVTAGVSITVLVSSVAGTAAFFAGATTALWRWSCKREELFSSKVEDLTREFSAALLEQVKTAGNERDECRRSRQCCVAPPATPGS